MSAQTVTVWLVVPMAREPMWLTTRYVRNKLELSADRPDLRLLFVSDREHEKNEACVHYQFVQLPAPQQCRVRFLRQSQYRHSIKGGAVHTGFQEALGAAGGRDLIGFTDLDGAMSNRAITHFVDQAMAASADLAIATRAGRTRTERVTSAAFQVAVKLLFPDVRAVKDMQAGLKLASHGFLTAYYACHERECRSLDVTFNLDWDMVGYAEASGYRLLELPVPWEPNADFSARTVVNIARTLAGVVRKRLGRDGGLLPRPRRRWQRTEVSDDAERETHVQRLVNACPRHVPQGESRAGGSTH